MTTSGDSFDGWLEQQLQGALQAHPGPSPLATQATYHAAALTGAVGGASTISTISAAVTGKAAAGMATAALVVAGGGAAAAAAATGSPDPGVWGQTVTQAVRQCRSELASGDHGIGQCVSAVASQHGPQERDQHSATAARDNHASEARTEHSPASGQSRDDHGRPTNPPTARPTDLLARSTPAPTAKPTAGSQGGPPSGNPGQSHR